MSSVRVTSVRVRLALRLTLLVVAVSLTAASAATVTKVEPPNWWPGHTLNPVRVLIRGTNLSHASVTAPGGLTAGNVRSNQAGTYLFVDITIPAGAQAGDYPLQIQTQDGTVAAPFRLEAPLSPEGRFQGFSPDDVIYLIMPDRFADGDPSNNDPAISRGLFDRANPHQYHGGDLQGIIDHLPYLKSLGVTAIWITPVYDNTNEPNRRQAVKGQPIADYHGYGATDYYALEEHFGTLALLRKLVDDAHRLGLKVIQDQVANHVGPSHPWVTDPPKPTWFHGTASHHINETWQIWELPDPHASTTLQRDVVDGWFADALPDLNQEDPDVARYEIQNALWWVGMAGFDGIRQDTLPYVPRAFWRDWSAALKRQYPNLRAVGEVFDGNPAVPSFFQGGVTRSDIDTGVDSVFDFPTYFDIREVFAKGGSPETLSKTLAEDRLYPNPDMLVTFLGNHDVLRFMSEKGADADKLKLAFTFLLTVRGTPCIYYGDEIGMRGGDDPDNRRDFPGGFPHDPRNAFEASGRTSEENAIWNYVEKLTSLRAKLEPLRRGNLVDLAVTKNTWVYARESTAGTAIIVINNSTAAADISIPYIREGTYESRLAGTKPLTIAAGSGTVHLPAFSADIYYAPGSR
ncbi:MAG: cyclomaltodextrinase N-terminal domain-containing protein [Acidobacteriaceae bacterium]|nr:cyclomaltodextrinase N-terminal domain-containing protein [Acidobacteriaceae bacterium]